MIRPILKDPIFLSQKSTPATVQDLPVAQDLRDTLEAHRDGCVGMAANMIGVAKRIIIFDDKGSATVMFNPEIVKCSGAYEAEEGSFFSPPQATRLTSIRRASNSAKNFFICFPPFKFMHYVHNLQI